MIQQIRIYVNELFADAPQTKKAAELKEEVCSFLIDYFVDITGRGMSEEEAYKAAIASIGDIDELFKMLEQEDEDPASRRKNALLVSIAVMLYIISVVPLFIANTVGYDEELGLVAMLAICAVATGLLVFNYMTRPKYRRLDDTMVEEFKEWKQQRKKDNGTFGAISGALWTIIVAIYFLISFGFGIWHVSWIVFLIGIAIQQIIRAVMQLNR